MRAAKQEPVSKFQRYRSTQKARGMKLIRIWVPDPTSPTFRLEAKRQAKLLRGRPEEEDALDFIEQTLKDTKDWTA